ncbi:MAG TPA: esterase-like activity of phytase family protein [Thermomonospora sp.]|nr:esterase-like activity of phytase family protein [Thermomonospora sp.]
MNGKAMAAGVLAAVTALTGLPAVTAHADGPGRRDVRVTRFLGEQRLPHLMDFEGTTVGGLSGITRDPLTDTWYLISDDRWRYNPARFYTGRLDFNRVTGAFTGVRITGHTTFLRPDGTPFPGFGQPQSADPETIRYDRRARRLLWAHEGDRPDETHPGIPVSGLFVRWTDREGRFQGELPLPANLTMTDAQRGPRRNLGFEGLAVGRDRIAAIVEGPRYEDGPIPTTRRGAPVRITVWDRRGAVRGQYAYPLDPLPAAPNPPNGAYDTGVSELLAIDDERYLALERSWIEGVGYKVRLYQLDLRDATDIQQRDTLTTGRPYRMASKRLVYDFGLSHQPVQNLEALAWGPHLLTGECTLVAGSDDNFDSREVTQFLAFAVRGC